MSDNRKLTDIIKGIEEASPESSAEIIKIFNESLQKKSLMRSASYSDLLDKIIEQMGTRLDKRAGEFSNKDLLDYLKVIEEASRKTSAEELPVPTIQNNTQININNNELSRESRENVINCVKQFLNSQNNLEIKSEENISNEQ